MVYNPYEESPEKPKLLTFKEWISGLFDLAEAPGDICETVVSYLRGAKTFDRRMEMVEELRKNAPKNSVCEKARRIGETWMRAAVKTDHIRRRNILARELPAESKESKPV